MVLFKPKADKRKLLDMLDLEIEDHTKKSRLLGEEGEKLRREAVELARDRMDDAAKGRLTSSLLCKQLRSTIEATITRLKEARLRLLTQPERPASQIIEQLNVVFRESAIEKERTAQAIDRMTSITQVEFEGYGIKKEALDEEFQRLKEEVGSPVAAEHKEEEIEKAELPEVPERGPETKPAAKKEKEEEKS